MRQAEITTVHTSCKLEHEATLQTSHHTCPLSSDLSLGSWVTVTDGTIIAKSLAYTPYPACATFVPDPSPGSESPAEREQHLQLSLPWFNHDDAIFNADERLLVWLF